MDHPEELCNCHSTHAPLDCPVHPIPPTGAERAIGILEHEMQPIPGTTSPQIVALTMGEAEVIISALRRLTPRKY